jgi:TolB-like protein/DNA-binding winged helix-turn-helix (wHTH) protein/tetratricopeptide (TPR) repeat protein
LSIPQDLFLDRTVRMEPASTIFRFGDYESRSRTRELYVRGSKLKIRPQPLRVLNLLLARAGDVVTREELRRELWSTEIFVDFEHVLNTSIKEIRAVLNDSATEPRWIETLPKLGYRFIAPVERIEPAEAAGAVAVAGASVVASPNDSGNVRVAENFADAKFAAQTSPLPADDASSVPLSSATSSTSSSSALYVVAAVLAAVILLGGAIAMYRVRHPAATPNSAATSGDSSGIGLAGAGERAMIAVLPFQNLTGDDSQDYFSDGMTEEMIAQLGHLNPQRLGVIARTSVMHYQGAHEPLDQIARELGVQYVLEGSVRRDAEHVRITAQLIRTSDQTHILSRQYDRELHSVLAVQGEIAQEISDEIQTALGAPGTAKPVVGANGGASSGAAGGAGATDAKTFAAYDDYLRGRYFWNKRTVAGFEEAAKQFQQSVAKDPTYARSYAGLADTYALMAEYDVAPASELIPKARAAALKALELDGQSAEAHASLALIAQNYDWDWPTAEKEFRRAIELDPNYATGHHWYAEHLAFQGRFDECFAEMQRAMQLDPLSLIIKTDNGVFLYYAGQYERSVAQFQEVRKMEPNFTRAHLVMFPYLELGRVDEAVAAIAAWRKVESGNWGLALEAEVFARTGRTQQARHAMEELKQAERREPVDPFSLVAPNIALGNKDAAFAALDHAIARHSPGLTALKVDPAYNAARGDARFQAALKRLGFVQ